MCLAIPGKIESISGRDLKRIATVQFGPIRKEINLSFLPEAKIGNYILVHAGVAISIIDEKQAQENLTMLGIEK